MIPVTCVLGSLHRAAAGIMQLWPPLIECLWRGQALSWGLCSHHSWPVMLETLQEEKHFPSLLK